MTTPTPAPTPTTTIVTAVEAGVLEQQVTLLAESLRLFGGRWSDLPILAVQPRRGPSLTRATLRRLDSLGVHFVRANLSGRFSWWNHYNKAAALRFAEGTVDTPLITWLDSDMVVVGEPSSFAPAGGAQFTARAGASWDVATNGDDDTAPYWRELCRVNGIDMDSFPDILSFPQREPIKAYFHGGNYTYDRSTRLSATHAEIFESMLSGSATSRTAGMYHVDQVALALAVRKLDLTFSELEPSMNANLSVGGAREGADVPLDEISVLHYHGALWPPTYAAARRHLAGLPDDRLALIDRYAPWHDLPPAARAVARALKETRSRRVRSYKKSLTAF